MRILISVLLIISSTPAASPLTETERNQLIQRIQQGDANAMLEAGKNGDPALIPTLEGFLQSRRDAVTETMTKLEQALAQTSDPESVRLQILPKREVLMLPEYDTAALNARMALAKLGVRQYLDEILTELKTPTNSTLFKVCYSTLPGYGYHIQVDALRKLAYVKDPSTTKDIAGFLQYTERFKAEEHSDERRLPLATFAARTLHSMVENPPQTNDPLVWQQWWEKNKDKYP